jgi:hypothetical protein
VSTLKVDTINTTDGSGNITFSRPTVLQAGDIITADILDANVTTAKVADNAITLAKMAGGVDGNIISYDASGDPVAVVTGSSGQVLTSAGAGAPPTFAAAAAGGAWTKIGTSVASGSASLTVTGLDSTYDTYAIGISDITPNTDNVSCLMQLGDSSGIDSGASDYGWHRQGSTDTGAGYGAGYDADDTSMGVIAPMGNATGEGGGGMLYLHRPGDGTAYPFISGTSICHNAVAGQAQGGIFLGMRQAVITVDRVLIKPSSGTFLTGRLTVWGISHA